MVNIQDVYENIDRENAVAFLQSLVRVNTVNPTGNELLVARLIQERLSQAGINSVIDEFEDNRGNLYVSYGEGDKNLVFSGHFDTVPIGEVEWEYGAFSGEVVDTRLYGRGTTDMKSGVAAMVLALEYLAKAGIDLKGRLSFIGTAGEEVDCCGARRVIEKGIIQDATAMVVGEPSSNEHFYAHKGALWLTIHTYGKTAHGSMPDQGINAILAMGDIIKDLEQYHIAENHHAVLGNSTMNIGTIKGGVKTNVVPDACSLTIDMRTVPGQEHSDVISDIQNLVAEVCKKRNTTYKVEVDNDLPAVSTDPEQPFLQLSQKIARNFFGKQGNLKTVNYYTDASIFSQHLDIPILIYGPGKPQLAHQPDEYVDIDLYIESIQYYMALAYEYLT